MIPVSALGVDPIAARKRFSTEEQAARARGVTDPNEVRRSAIAHLALEVEQRRPLNGPLASEPITISLNEYVLEGGRIRTVRTKLVETTPE